MSTAIEAAFEEFWGGELRESSSRHEVAAYNWAKKAFQAGFDFAAKANTELIKEYISTVGACEGVDFISEMPEESQAKLRDLIKEINK